MAEKSKDMTEQAAITAIAGLLSIKEVGAFTKGDNREAVVTARDARFRALKGPKAGETGSITDTNKSPEGPVEGTKAAERNYVTIEDVIKKQRSEGKKI